MAHAEVDHVLRQLAAAESPEAHKATIHGTSPEGAKALATVVLALHKSGHGPDTPLGRAQLALLAHPGATHEDFKAVAEDQHGGGFGSYLGGLARGLLSHPAAKELATRVIHAFGTKAVDALAAHIKARVKG